MDEAQNQVPQNQVVYEQNPSSPVKKIVSIVIGLIVVLGIIGIVIFFVLPMFASKEPEEAELTYWGVWEDEQAFEEIAADFMRENPDITINFEKQDIKEIGTYVDRLATRSQNGTAPDLFRYHNSWLLQIYTLLLPLPDSVIKATELDTQFYPVVANDLTIQGAYYGVPRHFDSLSLFLNTELIKDAGLTSYPATWDDLLSVSRRLTVKDSEGNIITSGVALGTYDNIAHASDIVSLLMVQNGADLFNLNSEESSEESAAALDYYTSFARGEDNVWDTSMENSKLAFAKGNLAMYFGYSWDIFEIKGINPSLEFAIVSVPSLQQRSSTIASYWVEGVSATTKYPKAAFKFLEYLTSRSTMEKLYSKQSETRLFGELYPRSDMAVLLEDNTLTYPFVSQGPEAASTIFSSDTYDEAMVDRLNSYMGNAVRSVVDDNTSPESAIETLANGVNEVLSQYVQQSSN